MVIVLTEFCSNLFSVVSVYLFLTEFHAFVQCLEFPVQICSTGLVVCIP